MTAHEWTAAMIGFFTDLYNNEGRLSFTAIATAMNAEFNTTLTRNACIGKSHRLYLPIRGPHERQRTHQPTGEKKMRRKSRIDASAFAPSELRRDKPIDEPLTIYQLREGDCHWPLGEMQDLPPFQYCGKASLFGRPYCKGHSKIAYNAPRERWG